VADTETRYTLAEAERLLARRECLTEGHALEQEVVRTAGGETVHLILWCSRCGGRFTETGGPWT
jgi:hypothetical protein